jgi:hypothetical protein
VADEAEYRRKIQKNPLVYKFFQDKFVDWIPAGFGHRAIPNHVVISAAPPATEYFFTNITKL